MTELSIDGLQLFHHITKYNVIQNMRTKLTGQICKSDVVFKIVYKKLLSLYRSYGYIYICVCVCVCE